MYTLLHTFFSIMVHHRILNTVLCAMRKKPVVYSFSVRKSGGSPGGSEVKNLTWVPSPRKDPLRGGNGNPLQYSCLENPVDRGAWWAI